MKGFEKYKPLSQKTGRMRNPKIVRVEGWEEIRKMIEEINDIPLIMKELGCSYPAIATWLNGYRSPRLSNYKKLKEIFRSKRIYGANE